MIESLINVSCRLDRDTHRKLRMMCFEEGVTVGDLLKQLLAEWMRTTEIEKKGRER